METIEVIKGGQKATLKSAPGISITIGGAIVTAAGDVRYEATVESSVIGNLTADQFDVVDTTATDTNTGAADPNGE
jgi:hypothetical protein